MKNELRPPSRAVTMLLGAAIAGIFIVIVYGLWRPAFIRLGILPEEAAKNACLNPAWALAREEQLACDVQDVLRQSIATEASQFTGTRTGQVFLRAERGESASAAIYATTSSGSSAMRAAELSDAMCGIVVGGMVQSAYQAWTSSLEGLGISANAVRDDAIVCLTVPARSTVEAAAKRAKANQ